MSIESEHLALRPKTANSTVQTGTGPQLATFLEVCQLHACSITGICLLLAAATLLCYWPVTHHEFINFGDDHQYITENPQVQAGLTWQGAAWAFRTSYASNWHPLTWVSHMADYELYGLNPGGHHFTSLLFHLANTLLVFLLLNRITGAKWRSAFVAALFALHPLHVESVAWASERKDVLSTFFFLLTLGAYARYAEAKVQSPKSKVEPADPSSIIDHPSSHSASRTPHSALYYFLALFLFALGLMSKPMVVTLPFVLLLLDYWPLGRFDVPAVQAKAALMRRLVAEKVPFFFFAIAASVVTFVVQRAGGAVSSTITIPLSLRISNALMGYVRYLTKTLWPVNLSPFYPYKAHWPVGFVILAALLLVTLTLAFLIKVRRHPYLVIGWFWFLGTLVPAIGLVQVGSQSIADRYMYIPSIGLFLLLVWGLNDLCPLFSVRLRVLAGAGATALAGCLLITELQLGYWQDGVKLFQHAIDATAGNYVAYNYLGKAYDDCGRKDLALALCSESVRLAPHYVEGQYNLGTLLLDMGRIDEAERCLTQAIADDPGFVRAYNNLGKALLTRGHLNEGINRFAQATKLNPDWPEAHYNLGTALLRDSKPAEAIGEFSEALRLNPRYGDAHVNFGVALINLGRTNEALTHFAEAVYLSPDNPEARLDFGTALLERDRPAEAASQFASGLQLRPDDVRMRSRLAQALARK